jgi:hypothetical protein
MKTKTLFKIKRTTVKGHLVSGLLFGMHISNETKYRSISFAFGIVAVEFEYKKKVKRTEPEYGVFATKYTGKY